MLFFKCPLPRSMRPLVQGGSTTQSRSLKKELTGKYGESQSARLDRGLRQMAQFWKTDDGDAGAFESSCSAISPAIRRRSTPFSAALNHYSNSSTARWSRSCWGFASKWILDLGAVQPYDEIFGGYDPSAHATDDFFKNKLAFVVLLNFPLTTLEQRLKEGASWSRRQWAEVRLAQRFARRVPAEVNSASPKLDASRQYIAEYNIWMHHVLDDGGRRLFPAKMRLLSHWNCATRSKPTTPKKTDCRARRRSLS